MMSKAFLRIALVATLAVSAAGCSQFKGVVDKIDVAVSSGVVGDVAPRIAVAAIATYDTGVVLATAYQNLPRCTGANGPLCRDPALRTQIDAAVYAGRSARNNLKAFMRAHPDAATPRAAYDALVAANATIDQSTAAYRQALGR